MTQNFAQTTIYQLFPLMHNASFGEETKLGSFGYFVCKD